MKKIRIEVPQKEYDVLVGNQIFNRLANELKKRKLNRSLLLLVDTKVYTAHKNLIEDFKSNYDKKIALLKIKSSEEEKSISTSEKIFTKLINGNFGRDSAIVVVGGGILGDIAGYAAATYMRGIEFVQIPTTLLSAVDSSVGGKTGVNFGKTKNIIGAFHQPSLVMVDTDFFTTLPKVEVQCGVGEIVKYAYLTNQALYNQLKKKRTELYVPGSSFQHKIIQESIKFKGNVVSEDEKESGLRKILNLGHTFAHAFEVDQNHKIKHGQAVVVGIVCASILAKKLGLFDNDYLQEQLEFLKLFSVGIQIKNPNYSEMYKTMLRDKKNLSGEIKFVLYKGVGDILVDVFAPQKLVMETLKEGLALYQK